MKLPDIRSINDRECTDFVDVDGVPVINADRLTIAMHNELIASIIINGMTARQYGLSNKECIERYKILLDMLNKGEI